MVHRIANENYYKNIDSYLKCIDYFDFFEQKNIKLDDKDKEILRLLNTDCRMSLTDISRKTRIPIDTVKYRIERMEKEKIFHYAIVMDPLKIGYPIYDALYLNLVNFTKEEEKRLEMVQVNETATQRFVREMK